MLDFFRVQTREAKDGKLEVYPNFIVGRSDHLMVQGGAFHAIWDEATGLWSKDEYKVQELVDKEVRAWLDENGKDDKIYSLKLLQNFDSGMWSNFQRFVKNISDNVKTLDNDIIFYDQETKLTDYATKKLPYPLTDSEPSAWNEIVGTLYSPEERRKIEWAIGSVFTGDSKFIQKFLVFQGPPGTGKSTILDIIAGLFEGYTATFDAKALGNSNSQFSTAAFKENPLVAIQQDGDLSKIDDNTQLNTIISHEMTRINEKNKPVFDMKVQAFLFMGTNGVVKISDAKSGLIRRLIDVEPTGDLLAYDDYRRLTKQVEFEYGAIAKRCIHIYESLGESYYNDYIPIEMMFKTDPFLNFVSESHDAFFGEEYVTMARAYDMYREHCDVEGIDKPMRRQAFQNELSNYFDEFHSKYVTEDGKTVRNVYTGFNFEKYERPSFEENKTRDTLEVTYTESIFDKDHYNAPAQLASKEGTPRQKWDNVATTLSDIDTSELHYVKVPHNHIVIDFDKTVDGEKDLEENLKAANKWPRTYAELSKSGKGVHLHYIYDGDSNLLEPVYEEGVEIKVYKGNSSLRRKLTYCNNRPVVHISSGLPIKEEKDMSDVKKMTSEKSVRDLIIRNLQKEFHSGTKPSVDFIKKILQEAYDSGMTYDLTDMRGPITSFAASSTNQALTCLQMVKEMKFKSDDIDKGDLDEPGGKDEVSEEDPVVLFDVEVYPNLFGIVWKYHGDSEPVRMVNPTPEEVGELFKLKLVGFNNRRYDNHILYGRYMGYDNQALYDLSQRIIGKDRGAYFGSAWNLSYADIYDYSSKKQSLKKWEFELGVKHLEMDIPWNKPVPEDMVDKVMEYCENDVMATEAVYDHLQADLMAREILADLSGLTVNTTTQNHTAKIVFEGDNAPQEAFVYTDLESGERSDGSRDTVNFPGYKYDMGVSTYLGEKVGEGGYVYAEPGLHDNVALIDVASMHPNSIRNLNAFGKYTKNFTDLLDARVAIKHGDLDKAAKMLDGKLSPYLQEKKHAKDLAYALKIVINIVYGLTSAKFDNKFRDPRNKDNIVAKRGALFMIDLKHYVQEQGYNVAHIKTDSIKIPDADEEIIQKVISFGKVYGYDFEHEATYEKFGLVNDAVYVAKEGGKWSATGAQFLHPYVFKTLFSGEEIEFKDYIESKSVQKGYIWLDRKDEERSFIGKFAQLIPVNSGFEFAGKPLRIDPDTDKEYAVAGTSGHFWAPAEMVTDTSDIDITYFEGLVTSAVSKIEEFGNFEEFRGDKG